MRRETCYECGRKETWREWWRMRKLRKQRAKQPPDSFAQIVSAQFLEELRPSLRLFHPAWEDALRRDLRGEDE
jgi:hypothetical protein